MKITGEAKDKVDAVEEKKDIIDNADEVLTDDGLEEVAGGLITYPRGKNDCPKCGRINHIIISGNPSYIICGCGYKFYVL